MASSYGLIIVQVWYDNTRGLGVSRTPERTYYLAIAVKLAEALYILRPRGGASSFLHSSLAYSIFMSYRLTKVP